MLKKIKRLSTSTTFQMIMAMALIVNSIYDLYEELFVPSHQHILLFIGVLIIISSIRDLFQSSKVIVDFASKGKETAVHRLSNYLNTKYIRIFFASMIIVTSCYGLYKDFSEILHSSVSLVVGIIMIIILLFSGYESVEQIRAESKNAGNK